MTKEQLGARLKELRVSAGVSQYRINKDAGIHYDTIKAIEEGNTAYTIDTLLAYLSVIDAEIEIRKK